MGSYRGNYQTAFKVIPNLQLDVEIRSLTQGTRFKTTYAEDSLYIPQIWLTNVVQGKGCSTGNLFRLRLVRLFLNENDYLQLPFIFKENTPECNQFFYDASINSEVKEVGLYPEIIRSRVLESWVTP